MNTSPPIPARRPPHDIISYAVWLYHRFNQSQRDIEDLLAEHYRDLRVSAFKEWERAVA
jgi:putative transposase